MPLCYSLLSSKSTYMWTASREFGTYSLCEQRRFRRVCASAQSRQNLRCSLIQAVSQEEPSDRKPDPWSLWMARHAQLKFVVTECSKTQIRLTGLMYEEMFKGIEEVAEEHGLDIKLESFRPHYERATIEAIKTVFKIEKIEGCFFHLSQAHWRKIQELGLRTLYTENEDISVAALMLTAMSHFGCGEDL